MREGVVYCASHSAPCQPEGVYNKGLTGHTNDLRCPNGGIPGVTRERERTPPYVKIPYGTGVPR